MISLYMPGQTWLHRLGARFKLAVLAIVGMLLFPVGNPFVMAAALGIVTLLYVGLGARGLRQIATLRPMLSLLIIIFALHALTGDWRLAFVSVFRLGALVLLANLVSITTRMDDMMAAVTPLFAPLSWCGVSPHGPAMAMALVLRFTPVFLSIHAALREAYQARTGKKASWRLFAPFFLQSLAMSENVAEALAARGGTHGLKKTGSDCLQNPT